MFIGVFFLNVKVYAASDVITISANGNTQGATVSGTTDDDVVAVLIEILDESSGIITLETHAVMNGSYNATLSCALTEGEAYTAYVVNYNGTGTPQSTSFTVPVSVTGVSLNTTAETITTAGGTVQLIATVAPANASNQNVTWSTSDASVATVDATGKVTAVGNGTATITATTVDGSKTATATITLNISSGGNNGENNDNSNNNNSNNNNGNDSNNSNTSNNQSDSDNNQVEDTSLKTGDENNLLLWVFLLIGSFAAVTGMGIINIRRKADSNIKC